MYKNKHHSQFNSAKNNEGARHENVGYEKDEIRKMMHSEQFIGKKDAKNK